MGCFTLLVLFFVLALAFAGGGWWALRQFQNTYLPSEPLEMPTTLEQTTPAAPEPASPDAPPSSDIPAQIAPAPTAAPTAPPIYAQSARTGAVQERWDEFERAAKRGQPARIELTAAEINALIQAKDHLRGKAVVGVEGDVGRVRVSVPIEGVFMLEGRYLNGEATVRSSPDGDPAKAQITDITFGNQPMGDDIIDRRLFGWSSIRMLLTDWLQEHNITTFRVENGVVIGETSGGR
ncbi:hypothetical protein BH20VER1_BH20VER1_18960 [soil metagenome]